MSKIRQVFFSGIIFHIQGGTKRMDSPIFKSSDYNFTLIASIWKSGLFVMNFSLKRGTVCPCGSIKSEDTHRNVFSVRSQFLHFYKILRGREFVALVT